MKKHILEITNEELEFLQDMLIGHTIELFDDPGGIGENHIQLKKFYNEAMHMFKVLKLDFLKIIDEEISEVEQHTMCKLLMTEWPND